MLNSLKNKVRLALQLSPSDWLYLGEAWGILLGFWLALRWFSYDSLSTSNLLIPKTQTRVPEPLKFADRLYQLVSWASCLHILPMTCLTKSLTLQRILVRRGIDAQIKIGAHKTSLKFGAHAWVEVNEQAIGESESTIAEFKVLAPNPVNPLF